MKKQIAQIVMTAALLGAAVWVWQRLSESRGRRLRGEAEEASRWEGEGGAPRSPEAAKEQGFPL